MKRILTIGATALATAWLAHPLNAEFGKIDELRLAKNMYSAQRAWEVGDLLTVNISETTSSNKSETFKTEKDAKADADAPIFGASPAAMHHWLSSTLNKHLDIPSYKVSATMAYDGKGASSSSESLSMSFTVRVVDVLENGVLVVRGDRRVLIRNESISMVLTGLVRPWDISEENTIESSQIADAHIYYETDGEVSRGTRPGWAWRILQFISPW